MTCRAQHNIKPSRFIYSFGIIMMLGACVSAKSPEEMPAIAALSVAHIEPSRDNGASGKVKNEPFAGRKEAEKSLGAECGKSYTYEFLLTDTACYGYLPEKMADFLRNLQPPPYVTRKQHEAYSREKQTFKAIRGLGEHPDFAVILGAGQLWVRSFEGPNPETTVYLVHGAGCTVDCERDTSCPPCFKPLSNYRLFRVMGSGKPQDVTRELMPPAPKLTSAERKRYGIYFQPKGEANDADLELDITRLQYVPSLRWVATPVQEGDYDAPAIPASDPRFFEDSDRAGAGAHFGFLVWTGISFELREKVPYALWPCKRAGLERSDCLSAHDRGHDRYIIDDKAAKQEGEQP